LRHYRVFVTPEAESDIRFAFEYIRERASLNGDRWLHGLYKQIATLEEFPERCGFARENDFFLEEIRQYVYKSHRVLFVVDHDAAVVRIVAVRHGRQSTLADTEQLDA
jgi:plasmid stabilization system protein ParE